MNDLEVNCVKLVVALWYVGLRIDWNGLCDYWLRFGVAGYGRLNVLNWLVGVATWIGGIHFYWIDCVRFYIECDIQERKEGCNI